MPRGVSETSVETGGTRSVPVGDPGRAGQPTAPALGRDGPPTSPVAVRQAVVRAVEAVERLRDAAPPRRLAVELPELGGLRLLLEASGTTIHVRPLGGDPVLFDAVMRDLGPSLAARGFDLASSGGRGGRDAEEPLPTGASRGPRRRSREGVRI